MPYENERANSYGYSSFIDSDFINDRLKTFMPKSYFSNKEVFNNIPVIAIDELSENVDHEQVDYVISIDGSLADVSIDDPFVELGFLKIGVVVENLKRLRKLNNTVGPIDEEEVNKIDKTYTINAILPGRGVTDTSTKLTVTDKFRMEIYENLKHLSIDPELMFKSYPKDITLMDVLLEIVPKKDRIVSCSFCHEKTTMSMLQERCTYCQQSLMYFSDFLNLHDKFNENNYNNVQYSESMSTFERIIMSGLLIKASHNLSSFSKTAFFTDGPLALFRSVKLAKSFRDQLNKLPNPLLAGFEKTGQFVDFANVQDVQNILQPGMVAMITTEVAQKVTGQKVIKNYGSESFYGKRFFYKTRSGMKTFVFSVPSSGVSLYDTDAETWDNYPTLKTICELIEETQTDMYGTHTAALSCIAKANETASIPKNLGQTMLSEMFKNIITENDNDA